MESAGKAEYGKMTGILHTLYDMHSIIMCMRTMRLTVSFASDS